MRRLAQISLVQLVFLAGAGCSDDSGEVPGASVGGAGGGAGVGGSAGTGGSAGGGAGGMGGAGGTCSAPRTGPRIVGYLPTYRGSFSSWARGFDFGQLTHLTVAFASPASDGTVTMPEQPSGALPELVQTAHACNVKVLVAFGGGADTTGAQIRDLIQPAKVQGFAAKILEFVHANALDGVDVDLEGASVNENYAGFVTALSDVLKPEGKLISAALGTWFADRVPDSALAQMDFISAMAYDEYGSWTDAGHHSSYELAVSQMQFWVGQRGVPAEKAVLGLPFYGWYWGAENKALTYAEILEQHPDAAGADWIEGNGFQLSYNGAATIRQKTEFSKTYGGAMVWELGQDAGGAGALLKVVTSAMDQ